MPDNATHIPDSSSSFVDKNADLAYIFEHTANEIYVFDADSLRLILANRSARAKLAYSSVELQHLSAIDIYPDHTLSSFQDLIAPLKNQSSQLLQIATAYQRKDGCKFLVEVQLQLLSIQEKLALVAMTLAVSEVKRYEQPVSKLQGLDRTIISLFSDYLTGDNWQKIFDNMLTKTLALTESEYGFFGQVIYDETNTPYLKTYAISNIAWNAETLDFYQRHAPDGLEFKNLENLVGAVIKSKAVVISNNPANDTLSGGIPEGHPPLDCFIGVPFFKGGQLVGMMGLANRSGGYDQKIVDFLQPLSFICGNMIVAIRTEQKLANSQKLLSEAQEIAKLGNWEWYPEKEKFIASDEINRIMDIPANQKLSLSLITNKIHPEDREKFQNTIDKFFPSGKTFEIECRIMLEKNDIHYIQTIGRSEVNATGQLIRVVGTTQDITERKQAVIALVNSKRMLQTVLDTIPVRVFWKDRELNYLGCNFSFAEDAGLIHPQEIIGKNDLDLSWREQAVHYRANDRQIMASGIEKINYIEPQTRNFGRKRFLKTSKIPLQDIFGNIIGILGCYEDITSFREAEEKLRETHQRLLNLVERLHLTREDERKKIAQEIHDEFGQVLTILKMDMSWLHGQLPDDNESLVEHVASMIRAIDKAADKVREVSSSLRPPLLDDFGVGAAIEWLAQSYEKRSGITFELNIRDTFNLNENQRTVIFRIVQESLTNVIRHSNADTVRIEFLRIRDTLALTIIDNGDGISENNLVSNDSIGLIGMQERTESIGGKLAISLSPQNGTIVQFSLPIVKTS